MSVIRTAAVLSFLSGTAAAAGPEDPPAADDVQRLERRSLRDPGTQNIESHTLLVPTGWSLEGGVSWTPAIAAAYVHVDADVRAPDGREVSFHQNGSFTWFETTMAIQRPQIGAFTQGRIFLPPGNGGSDFVLRQLLPHHRPQARDVEVVRVSEIEELARTWRELLAPMLESERQNNALSQAWGLNMASHTRVQAPLVRVRYTEGGRRWEEDFGLLLFAMESAFDDGWTAMRSTEWGVYDVRSLRAPAGELDSCTPLLRTVAASLQPTRRWKAMIDELNAYMAKLRQQTHRITMREIQKRSKMISQQGDELMAMHRDSWEKSQASQDRLNRAWSNVIRGVDDYQLPDGTTQSLDSSYDRVFTDQNGTFLFSNDHLFDPNVSSTTSWSEIEAVTPMGGAALFDR